RLSSGNSIVSGEIDVFITLTLNAFDRLTMLSEIDGVLDDYIMALNRHIVYTEKLKREGPRVVKETEPSKEWPQTGSIEFHEYYMRYLPELDPVLKGVTFSVSENEKVGIVGRTGAGKSSLTYALMRMVEPTRGYIKIDGVDISTIGTYDLRSRIAVIPQDPALFQGTIRENLDPYRRYTDDEVWTAIRAARMADLLDKPTRRYIPPSDNDDDDSDSGYLSSEGPW
ncbi:Canalicular multispecific organic anion transporter 1, partial [Coemansia sp. RSA 2607]